MSKERKQNNLQILISVLAAVALWFFVAFLENPAITAWERNVEVDVIGERVLAEQGLVMVKASTPLIDVKLSGTRQGIYGKETGDVTASLDISHIEKAGTYTVNVKADVSTRGLSVVETSPSQMEIVVEPLVTIQKEVKVSTLGTCAEGYSVLSLETPMISLTGPQSIVETLSLEADPITVEGASGDVNARSNIHMINSSGKKVFRDDCIMGASAVTVNCKVSYEKTVPIESTVIGSAPLGYEYQFRTSTAEVMIFGDRALLDTVTKIETDPIDITGITEAMDVELGLILPEGVSVKEGTTVTITVQPVLTSPEEITPQPTDYAELPNE